MLSEFIGYVHLNFYCYKIRQTSRKEITNLQEEHLLTKTEHSIHKYWYNYFPFSHSTKCTKEIHCLIYQSKS